MEVWTFINKKTNDIIRHNVIYTNDDCFDTLYFFTDSKYASPWFVFSKEAAEIAYEKEVHAQYSMSFERPNTEQINLNDYEIICFSIKN